jgi:hypothetical protein
MHGKRVTSSRVGRWITDDFLTMITSLPSKDQPGRRVAALWLA